MVPNGWKLVEANDICSSISVGVVIKPSQYYVEKDKGVKAFRSAIVIGFIFQMRVIKQIRKANSKLAMFLL